MALAELLFRKGTAADLQGTFALSERVMQHAAMRQGILAPGPGPSEADIRGQWLRHRSLVEFLAAQPEGRYVLCEDEGELVGYARVVRFGRVEQLTELMVHPEHQGRSIGRSLLEECWPESSSDDLARVVVANGSPTDLSLYTTFGVMPVAGHWHMRHTSAGYLAQRSHEDSTGPGVHVLKPDRAVAEWKRLEPDAIGHERPELHEFFGRDRTCLGALDPSTGEAMALCWVSSEGEIGPAVAASPGDLSSVLLAVLDRVAMTQEPEYLSVFVTTLSWSLIRRLRKLGFHVYWPSWVMCSEALPGLDRYVPTRPPQVL